MCCALGLKNKQNTTYIQGLGPRVIDPWWVPQVQDSLSECSHADYPRPATVLRVNVGRITQPSLPILVMNVSSSKASTTSMVTFRTCVGSILCSRLISFGAWMRFPFCSCALKVAFSVRGMLVFAFSCRFTPCLGVG